VTYRVAVAVSGRGSNLIALCDALAADASARVVLVIADRPALALEHARERGIPTHLLDDFRDGAEWRRILAESACDALVLAGYLRLVPADVVAAMPGRIINVHPALLPKYGGQGMHGARVHQAVIAAGDRESGASVHLVDEVYDRGAILAQGRVAVPAGATAETLAADVLKVEHRILPAAVRAAARAGHPVPFEFT
jgi:formyltetrahydrofolate-dependent phosphoribosylglycinamide formyltransferase